MASEPIGFGLPLAFMKLLELLVLAPFLRFEIQSASAASNSRIAMWPDLSPEASLILS